MNILVNSNAYYIKYLMVMLESLYLNHPGQVISVYVMHDGFTEKDEEDLHDQASRYGNRVMPVKMESGVFEGFPLRNRWPAVVCFRLFAADVLPAEVDRILYLDSDLIVNRPLDDLYRMNFDGAYLIACKSMSPVESARKDAGHLPHDLDFFNSGVMLCDLVEWRRGGINIELFLSRAKAMGPTWLGPDEDLLNAVFKDNRKLVDPWKYNFPVNYWSRYKSEFAARDKAGALPSIYHYTLEKPWDTIAVDERSGLDRLWWDYAKKTPYYQQMRQAFEANKHQRMVAQRDKFALYFRVLSVWLRTERAEEKFVDLLKRKGWRTIALYGANEFLEIVLKALQACDAVRVACVLDASAVGKRGELAIENPGNTQAYRETDAVVVTAFTFYDEIVNTLAGYQKPIVPLDELIISL